MTNEKKPVPNKPVQVSKAPPPISPLRGSGSMRSVLSPTPNNALPDWAKWKYMPELEAFQACALALNFDPDSMRRSPQSWMHPGADIFLSESFPSDELAGQFNSLMEIVKANKLQTIHFKINLPEFAAWCAPVVRDLTSREIPPELATLASNNSMQAGEREKMDKYLHSDLWSESDLQALLCGLPPDGSRPLDAKLNEAATAIQRAVTAGVLQPINKENATPGDRVYAQHRYFRLADAIGWANAKKVLFPAFPFSMDSIQQAEPAAVEQIEQDKKADASPFKMQVQQEDEILKIIKDKLKIDALKLPANKPGKRGVKGEVSSMLKWQGTIFKKAWERLSDKGLIKYLD